MSGEFSLLSHLGVQVADPCVAAFTSRAGRGHQEMRSTVPHEHLPAQHWKVLAPTQRPPMHAVGKTQHTPPRKTEAPPGATVTGEVLLRSTRKEPHAEYVIYDSHVPSIHGINARLMDRKTKERAASAHHLQHEDPESLYGGILPHDDVSSDLAKRRQLLAELQHQNRESAERRKDEMQRAARVQVEREREWLERAREEATTIAKVEAEEHRRKALEVQEDALDAVEYKKKLREEHRRQISNQQVSDDDMYHKLSDLSSAREARMRQNSREVGAANRQLADLKRAAHAADDAARQRQERAWLQELCEEESRSRAQQNEEKRRVAEEYGATAERDILRKRQQMRQERAAEIAAEREAENELRGSNAEEGRLKRAQEQRSLLEVNLKLAQRRQEMKSQEAEQEKNMDIAMLQQALSLDAEEKQRTIQRRRQQQQELRRAADLSIAWKRKTELEEKARDAQDSQANALAFRGSQGDKRRSSSQKAYYDDLLRQIAHNTNRRKVAHDTQRQEEQHLLMENVSASRSVAAKERAQKAASTQQYMKSLASQIDAKQQLRAASSGRNHTGGSGADAMEFHRGPTQHVLLRCPVTKKLYPPKDFDLTPRRHRASSASRIF